VKTFSTHDVNGETFHVFAPGKTLHDRHSFIAHRVRFESRKNESRPSSRRSLSILERERQAVRERTGSTFGEVILDPTFQEEDSDRVADPEKQVKSFCRENLQVSSRVARARARRRSLFRADESTSGLLAVGRPPTGTPISRRDAFRATS